MSSAWMKSSCRVSLAFSRTWYFAVLVLWELLIFCDSGILETHLRSLFSFLVGWGSYLLICQVRLYFLTYLRYCTLELRSPLADIDSSVVGICVPASCDEAELRNVCP